MRRDTHRTANGATWDGQLNDLIRRKFVDASSGEERSRGAGTAQNLEENWDSGLVESHTIDLECETCEVK